FFFFQAEDGIRDRNVTGVQTCALPISTGAPICILIPLSSWGAYVFSLLVQPINDYNLGIEPFTAFMMIIPANYYAIMALLIVFLTIYWQIDFSAMEKHEKKALET